MSERNEIRLSDIEVHYILECSQCGDPKEANGQPNSAFVAAQDFNSDGWKMIDGEPVCPDCQDEEDS